ncbi:DNRLRE domain-containing protein [Microbispora sp. ZYX-F-249]|uniref:DNRLRE domain-containing protein n=1 Tax=Microbispora maris TaxID=3144104 RepID=A0ABV0B0C6_9ACTN
MLATGSPTVQPGNADKAAAAAARAGKTIEDVKNVKRVGRITSRLTGSGSDQVLELAPDAEFLADPTVTYPVVVDPTLTLSPPQADTYINSSGGGSYYTDTSLEITSGFIGTTRSYLKFDTSTLAGAQITNATLRLYKLSDDLAFFNGTTGPLVQQITSNWDQTTLTWANKPSVTTTGQASIPSSAVHRGVAEDLTWTVTPIVQAWASGTANYGVQVRAANEANDLVGMGFHSAEMTGAGAKPPLLTVTYTTASAPAAGNLSITPVTGNAVSSLTPTLHATVSDPAGGNLRADYEIEHDPAYTAEGTGQIWAGSSTGVTSGNDAPAAVPAGKFTDGWHIRWRARATNTGTSTSSAWSAWQTAVVTVPDPVVDLLQVTPSQDLSGQTVTSTLTPALAARVTTSDSAASRVEFELEHDPADTQHGTGGIWTTGADDVASGTQATVTVPDGKLGDGWKVRWRARAVAAGSNTSAWSEWQSLTVKVPAATVSQLQITPAQTVDGKTAVSSLTPQLLATVTDAYGHPLRAEFELEHDPADTAHGTGGIWTGAADNVASGTQASVTVPGGALSNGWGIRWRVRAVNTATQVASAWSDWQTATVNAADIPSEPGVTALQVTPSQVVDGTAVATSLTPQLRAQVTNPAGGTLRAEFELEHDPAAPEGQGTGQIWASALDDVPAGTQASVTVPGGKLEEGWVVRWRARAVAGETASAWSDWQSLRVDQPDPVLGALQVTPSDVVDGKTVTKSLTPQLLAQVTDPAGGKVRAEFELEHDPAAPEGQGSGQIWAAAIDDVTSGTQATVTVPDGKLSDGWLVRWRARAITPGGTSAWSDWQQLTVVDGSQVLTVDEPRTQPVTDGTTNTLTPVLIAKVGTPAGGQLGAEFQVEHDPADTAHGTGQIWTTTVTAVTSGNDAAVTVPAGKLSDGWKIRWRARAVKGAATSDWTSWQSVEVKAAQHYDTTYEYDRDGRMTKQIDANGNVRTFTYDLLGRRTASHDPDAGDSQQAYDPAGRLAWSIDGKGQKVSYSYDDLGRKTAVWSGERESGTKLAGWVYDTAEGGIGKLTSATRHTNGHAYVNAVAGYDEMGRPTGSSIIIPAVEGALAGTYSFTAGYDTAGNLSQVGMPATGGLPAEKLTFTFTDLNLPQAVTSDLDGGTTYVGTTAYTRTARLSSRVYGADGRITRTLAWDENTGRLTGVTTKTKTDTSAPVTVQDDVFSYNIDDTINSILDKAAATAGSPGQSECFTYDGLRRLTQAWTTTATACGTGTASADGLGIDPYTQSYTWDGVGNLTSLTSGGQTATYTYSAPGANAVRPDAVTAITRPNGAGSYGYDDAGQMTSRTIDGKHSTFTYNELGELTKAVVDGQTTDNVYDAEGQRLLRRTPDGKTTLYLGTMELELSAGTVTGKRYYTTADGSQIAVRTPAALTWLLGGIAGSEQLAIDDTTQAARRERYLPFGQRRGDDDLPFTDRGFLGKIEDSSTGLSLLGARFYDPAIAKFLSPDPLLNLAKPGLTNAYGYAGGDPVNLSDPDGFEPRPWHDPNWKKKTPKERRRITQQYMAGERRAQRAFERREGEKALRNDKKGLGDRASEHIRYRNQVGNTRHHQAVWDEACRKDFVCSNLKEMDAITKSRGAGSLADVAATGGGPGVGSGGFAGMGMVRSLGSNRGGRTVLPPPGLRPRPCSFVPGTEILMADGSLKPIEDVKAGDHIVATDPQTEKTEYHVVLEPLTSQGRKVLVHLKIGVGGNKGPGIGEIVATDNHPFWAEDLKTWVPAGHLQPGTWLRTSAGTYVKVLTIQRRVAHKQRVYNLTVENFHTYYVLAGDQAVLVHNANPADCWVPNGRTDHIPSGWNTQPNKKGVGTRWTDPENQGNGVRIDQGNPDNPQPTQQVDHVIVRHNGRVIGRDGKPITGSIKDDFDNAHIPYSEWSTWSTWYAP